MIRIFTEGVFDLFHVGHLHALQRARSFGDYLIVGVHNDADVETYKRRPIIPFVQRLEIMRSISCVSEVLEVPLAVDEAFYQKHMIDFHVQGDDVGDHYDVGKRLNIVRFVGRDPTTSTTEIIERIIACVD